MLGDLFLACETPEAPKPGFLKNLFGGGQALFDREELCKTSGFIRTRDSNKNTILRTLKNIYLFDIETMLREIIQVSSGF